MGREQDGTLGLTGHLEGLIRDDARRAGVSIATEREALRAAARVARARNAALGRNWDAGPVLEAARMEIDRP